MLTLKAINKAIAHTGLTLIPGEGYFYFLDAAGHQAGESVYTFRMNHLPLSTWIEEAESRANLEE